VQAFTSSYTRRDKNQYRAQP